MRRHGVVLVEVLAALVILGVAGTSALMHVVALGDAQERAQTAEDEIVRAERLIVSYALLTRAGLEQRIGLRRSDEFAVWLDRPEASLFRVGVAPWDRPEVEILSTLLFRPDTTGVRQDR